MSPCCSTTRASRVGRPALLATSLALCAALAACGDRSEPRRPRTVLLISLDTLRADACGFLGSELGATPFLDSLAERGAVFTRHFSNSNNTLIAHTSILTGMLPQTHGVDLFPAADGTRLALAPGFETLAEAFAAADYRTVGFTTHEVWLSAGFGLDQGFERLDAEWTDAPHVTRKFLSWLDAEQPDDLFAFLHFYDAHSDVEARAGELPYDAPAELRERFAGPPPGDFTGRGRNDPALACTRLLKAVHDGDETLSAEELAWVRGLYVAGVAQLDRDLRALFDELERRGRLEDALVVITSDHGEEFGEHGGMLHYDWWDEILHVPLLVVDTRSDRPSSQRVFTFSRSIDVAPTLLELAGLAPFGQGQSLAWVLDLEPGLQRPGDGFLDEPPLVLDAPGLRSRDAVSAYKLILRENDERLIDLGRDPGEHVDLLRDPDAAPGTAERFKALRRVLRDVTAVCRRRGEAIRAGGVRAAEESAADREALRELGY